MNAYRYSGSPANSFDLSSIAFNTSAKRNTWTASVGKGHDR